MCKFSVGDFVRIRQWNDMVRDFGVTPFGIPCSFGFTSSMRFLCGKYAQIVFLYDDGGVVLSFLDGYRERSYIFTLDMIEKVSLVDILDKNI